MPQIQQDSCLVPIVAFTEDSPEPDYIKTLVQTESSWTGCFNTPATITYGFPESEAELNALLLLLPDDVTGTFPLGSAHKASIRTAMQLWESAANINLIETTSDYLIPIYQMTYNDSIPISVAGYGSKPEVMGVTYSIYNDSKIRWMASIGLKQALFQYPWYHPFYEELIPFVIAHELGHALGLEHPFDAGNFTLSNPEQLTSDYSVMNYDSKKSYFSTWITINPMPRDYAAMQFIYGPNQTTNHGDTYYALNDFTPKQSWWSWLNMIKPVTTLPWDINGTDTMSGTGLFSRHVIIDTNAFGASRVNNGMVQTQVDIENVIGGETSSKIILNTLNNIVDIRTKTLSATIITDPTQCGHDVIVGFNPDTDHLILRQNNQNTPWILNNIGPGSVMINGDQIQFQQGAMMVFDHDNTMTLTDVKFEYMGIDAITHKSDADIQTLLWDLFAELPAELVRDFLHAFSTSGLLTFALGMSQELLKTYGCKENQITAINKVMHLALIIFSGRVGIAPSIIGFYVHLLCEERGCTREKSQYYATSSALITQSLMTITAPEELLSFVATALGSRIGFAAGSWATKKIIALTSDEPPPEEIKKPSFYERGRLFTLWACKKVVTCCARKQTPEASPLLHS